MRHYPSYRLEDFYSNSFLDGGVTYKQLVSMFRYADEERYDNFKFHAAIHGIDLDATEDDEDGQETPKVNVASSGKDAQFLFKDPAQYESMTEEQREKETNKMMQHWGTFKMRSSPKQS